MDTPVPILHTPARHFIAISLQRIDFKGAFGLARGLLNTERDYEFTGPRRDD
jgi:hypothetical protein